jgi:hypothetical protein
MASVGAVFCVPPRAVDFPKRMLTRMLTMAGAPMIVLPSRQVWTGLVVVIGFLLFGGVTARAQQFSADLVMVRHDGEAPTPAGRLRVSEKMVRLETPELADGFFLIDGDTPSAYFVRPAARIFMQARQSSRLTRVFVPVDPADPCRQWQAMAKLVGIAGQGDWHCERTGEETIGARDTIRYLAVSGSGQEFSGWIDAVRKFPLRIETQDGTTVTAENIRDEPQPAQLFEMPAGLRKFDPRALIEQIKQSDVWVDGPIDLPRTQP